MGEIEAKRALHRCVLESVGRQENFLILELGD